MLFPGDGLNAFIESLRRRGGEAFERQQEAGGEAVASVPSNVTPARVSRTPSAASARNSSASRGSMPLGQVAKNLRGKVMEWGCMLRALSFPVNENGLP